MLAGPHPRSRRSTRYARSRQLQALLRFRINELRTVRNSVAQNAPSNLLVARYATLAHDMLDPAGGKLMAGGKTRLTCPDHDSIDPLQHRRSSKPDREAADVHLTTDVEPHEVHARVHARRFEMGVTPIHWIGYSCAWLAGAHSGRDNRRQRLAVRL